MTAETVIGAVGKFRRRLGDEIAGDLVAKAREVGREQRGGDRYAHWLSSRMTDSPEPIWKPAWGVWRTTMPAAVPTR